MKKPLRMLGILVLVVVFLSVAKNALTQAALTSALSGVTHVPVKVGGVNVSLLASSIQIKNLTVYNPSGFPEKKLLEVPAIFIDFEPGDLMKGRAHFKEIRMDLKEMTVIRDKNGRLNVDAMKPTEVEQKRAKERTEKSGKAPKLAIDKLYLTIGRVTYKDYSAGPEPAIQTFDINIKDRQYENIQDPMALVSLIMFETLTRTTLSKLADLDLHAFKDGGLEALSKSLGLAGNATEAAQSTAKKLASLFS